MPVLCQHIYLIVELLQQLLADVWVKDLLYSNLQLKVLALMNGAEASH
jgi:hypothetical protein